MPTAEHEAQAVDVQPGELINNRYRTAGKLGRGGMGSVFLVHDEWRGGMPLAMKRVRKDRVDSRTITILRNEFLALSALDHPNLAKVYDFEEDLGDQDCFFTSEYVDGVQLLHAARDLRIGREEDLRRLLECLAQILRALEFIHSRGLVHGDIKPENILVSGRLCEGGEGPPRPDGTIAVKMIDFGLTKREKEFGGKKIIGTTYYIAPETILGSQVDRRTDLYSLGVVLYHLATHKLPFTGDSNMAVMRGHIETAPRPPHEVEPGVPQGLSAMILRLLRKTPADRFGSAIELLEAVNAEFGADFPLETAETRLSYIRSPGFIAREAEVAELRALFDTVFPMEAGGEVEEDLVLPSLPEVAGLDVPPPPRGRLIILRGEAGVGKRRLLGEFRRHVQTRGAHFIGVDCAPRDGGRPPAFAALVRALVAVLSARCPRDMPDPSVLAGFFETVDRAAAEGRSLGPVIEKLAMKVLESCRVTPVVLALEGLSHAEPAAIEFVRVLVEAMAAGTVPDARIMAVATAEDEESDEAGLRRLLKSDALRSSIRQLSLRRFDGEEVKSLLDSMFGGAAGRAGFPERFAQLVHEESDGNPGVVRDIVEHLAGSGRLRRTCQGWTVEGTIERDAIPGKVRQELRGRIARLDPTAKRLAVAMAVLGSGTELQVAVRLAEIPPDRIFDAIWVLKQEKIVRQDSADSSVYSFIHSSARDILYGEIAPDDRPAMHDRAGALLESHLRESGREDPRRLAYHFLRSRNVSAALRYGIAAARDYAAQEPRKAIEVYGEVRGLVGDQSPITAREIDLAIARLHFQTGGYREAAEIFKSLIPAKPADEAASLDVERAGVLVELGEAWCRLGSCREASACFREALVHLKGTCVPHNLAALLLGYAELFHFKGNYRESLRYCERVLGWEKGIGRPDLLARLHLLLAENYFRLDDKEMAIRYCRRGLELLEGKHEVASLGTTLLYLGRFYKYKGKLAKALKQLQLCALVNGKVSAFDRQADALREMGAIHLLLECPEEAVGRLTQAIAIEERTGNVPALIESLNLRAEARRILGHYEDGRKDVEKALHLNAGQSGAASAVNSYLVCAEIAMDHGQTKTAEDLLAQALPPPEATDDRPPERATFRSLALRCALAMMEGHFAKALDAAAKGIIAGREAGNRMRLAPFLQERMRLYLALGDVAEARRGLGSLFDIAGRYSLPTVEGRAHLLEAMILDSEGRPVEAGKSFEKALRIFREGKCERDLADAYLEYGCFEVSLGNHDHAYLLLEEGFYVAKKLNLPYAKCLLYHAMGLRDAHREPLDFVKAEGGFLAAERLARSAPFPDLLWRVRYDLGAFYLDAGRPVDAARILSGALQSLRAVLEQVPGPFREPYLKASGRADLESLQAEAQELAVVHMRVENVRYRSRDPEKEEYFGLVGRSPAAKELFRALAAFPPDVPWVWVHGPPGSGRRDVAMAIHHQSAPELERLWVYPAAKLTGSALESVLADLESARKSTGTAGGGKGGQAALAAIPGRYSLVILDFQGLGADLQARVFERVTGEKGRPDGLRVIATLDRPAECFEEGAGPGRAGIVPELAAAGFPVVRVPPLAERREDIPLLVERFLRPPGGGEGPVSIAPEAVQALADLPSLAEVRDLQAACEKLRRIAGPKGVIGPEVIRTVATGTRREARGT